MFTVGTNELFNYVIIFFSNEREEYINEAMIEIEQVPAVIAALQAEYDRRTADGS